MSAAFEVGDRLNLSAIARLILLRLGDRADDFGYCWPGIDDLKAKVGVDTRTVQRHLASLEKDGLVVRLIMGGGRNRSTLYRILPADLAHSDEPPGLLRYLERFGTEIKGDTLPPFIRERLAPPGTETVTGQAKKRRHSSVTRSVMNHHEPSDDISNSEPDPVFSRQPGESFADYRQRTTKMIGRKF